MLAAVIRTHPPNISKFQYVLRLKVWEYNAGSASGPHHRRTIGSATKSESFAGIFREAHAHSSVCLVHGVVPAPQALTFQHEAPGGDLEADFIASELLLAAHNKSIWRPNLTAGRHQAPHVGMLVLGALALPRAPNIPSCEHELPRKCQRTIQIPSQTRWSADGADPEADPALYYQTLHGNTY